MAAINPPLLQEEANEQERAAPEILPLEHGDHLSREEFRRRYEAMPEVKKAELIEGMVYLPLMIDAPFGSSYIGDDGYLRGAPELVAEVAASRASYDLNEKKETYRRNGAQEYIVWQVYDRRIDWLRLEGGQYEPLSPDEDGVIRSRVFPGLWLDVEALLKDDMTKVLAVLQQGLNSSEHGDFVKQLAEVK